MARVNAFGCFDDCYNIGAGYFISKGRMLYSDIPFNHQMLMAYLSSVVQTIFHPINVYELILRHRQTVLLFGFTMSMLLVWRYRWVGLGFVLLYEFTKFYIFGDRYLAEGLIVYPLVYMLGLFWEKLHNRKISSVELLLSSIFAWFVIFMREPYTLAVLVLYAAILFSKNFSVDRIVSILVFVTLSLVTILLMPVKDYFYNLIIVNTNGILKGEIQQNSIFGFGAIKIFFYPLFIFFDGKWNNFRYILIGLSSVFLLLNVYYFLNKKKIFSIILLFFVLGLANIRFTPPGIIFYAAFHAIPWYGMFIFSIFLLLHEIYFINKKIFTLGAVIVSITFFYNIFSPQSFLHEKTNAQFEFITNYGNYLQVGEVVKALSNSNDTFFVDGFDELLHWSSDIRSPYKYSWYTSYMPHIIKYSQEREQMFIRNSPDFYYGSCPKENNPMRLMPKNKRNEYVRLLNAGKPSCLFIKKEKIYLVSKSQWDKARAFLFELPSAQHETIKN